MPYICNLQYWTEKNHRVFKRRSQPNLKVFHSPQATRRWHVPEGAGASTVWPEQITKQGRIATHQKVRPGGLGLMGQKEEVVFLPNTVSETMWTLTFLKIKQEPFVTQKLENKKKFLLAINFSGFSPPSYTRILSPSKHADKDVASFARWLMQQKFQDLVSCKESAKSHLDQDFVQWHWSRIRLPTSYPPPCKGGIWGRVSNL